MDLGSLAVRARLRGRWEAIDLGFLMARAWWARLWLAWFLPSSALLLALTVVAGIENLGWCALAVWWLKPVWDRLPLHIASRALFGEHVGVGAALRELPRLARRDLLAWLSWRRLSITRSFDMPVTLLEGLRGAQRRTRLAQLHVRSGDAASWLTFACVNIELILVLAAVGLIEMLLPADLDTSTIEFYTDHPLAAGAVLQIAAHLAGTLVAPFYTMAGFALYISRRIELEGWDIEIRFRHLAERHARARGVAAGGVAASAVLAISLLCAPMPSPATEAAEPPAPPSAQLSRERIATVLDSTDFRNYETVRGWRLRDLDSEEATDELPDWLERLLEWLFDDEEERSGSSPVLTMARVLEFALWVVFVSVLIWLAWRYRATLRRMAEVSFAGVRGAREAPPTELFGLDLRAESLPADVAADVLAQWRAQQPRAAFALLYRASLSRLVNAHRVQLAGQHTEAECVRIATAVVPAATAACFRELTTLWQRIAYAHRLPATEEVEALLARWRQAFDGAS